MRLTNELRLPGAFVRAAGRLTDRQPVRRTISVTSLIDSPQVRVLRGRHWSSMTEDVSSRVWAFFGTVAHAVLDANRVEGSLVEEQMETPIGDWLVTGRPDLYHDGVLTDWKVTSAHSVKAEGKIEWERQLNCYAHLHRLHGRPVHRAEIVAILRDWSRLSIYRDRSYPRTPVVRLDVPLWTHEQADEYLRERLSLHATAEDGHEVPCTDEERWARPGCYAVHKPGRKAALRLYRTLAEAEAHIARSKDPSLHINHRPSVYPRCNDYCPVRGVCPQLRAERDRDDRDR